MTKNKNDDEKLKELFDNDKLTHSDALHQLGVTLYPYKFNKQFMINKILDNFKDIGEDPSSETITTAGRLMQKRGHGKGKQRGKNCVVTMES